MCISHPNTPPGIFTCGERKKVATKPPVVRFVVTVNPNYLKVITDRDSGRSLGFGFVSYTSAYAANSALQDMDGTELDGRRIRVSVALEWPRPSFYGGYGGPGGNGYGASGGGTYGGAGAMQSIVAL
ncbi:unnamed protein product [Lactuca virosa]|uniref:RRM domain-containing protein n=1 Tax=Lactuca virosa TaxID=75947 RepID=A0AAU9LID3_9ASTR|nr:unnamed protein product [Lactuca virosa]